MAAEERMESGTEVVAAIGRQQKHFPLKLVIRCCSQGTRGFQMSTQRTRFLAVLSFAIGLSPLGAHAQDLSASDVLKKVAESYQQVSSFSVVAGKKIELDTEGGYIGPNGTLPGSRMSYDIQATLMYSSSSKAKLLLKDGKKEIVVVCDGKVVWTLIPAQNEYTEVSANTANIGTPVYNLHVGINDISGVELLRAYEFLLAARFQGFSGHEAWAKLEHSETLKVGKDKKECYVLMIQAPKGSQKQKLWVDQTDFTIWKSVDTTISPWGQPGGTFQTTITVTAEQMALNPSLDDSNFVFTPPDQAKKVDSLILSGSNPF
jgi:outer membrane lipoprotein-sorting protein